MQIDQELTKLRPWLGWHPFFESRCSSFRIRNGTKQGGVLSPYLFTRYVRDLIKRIAGCGIGYAIGNVFMNLFAYADDMVLLRGMECSGC